MSGTPAGSVVALDTAAALAPESAASTVGHVLCEGGVALAYHVIQRLEDDRVLVRDTAQRRIYADTILRIGRDVGLFCFGLPDTHSHAGVECDRSTAGRFVMTTLLCALAWFPFRCGATVSREACRGAGVAERVEKCQREHSSWLLGGP